MGLGGSFLYGMSERLLIPTGLHHILNSIFKYTNAITIDYALATQQLTEALSGAELADALTGLTQLQVSGAQGSVNLYSEYLNLTGAQQVALTHSSEVMLKLTFATGGRKQTFMMLGLPAAALAMYMTAHNKKRAAAVLLPAAMTAALTGVTEPMEFSFLFAAPLLYLGHAVLAGIGHVLYGAQAMYMGGAPVGLTMGGVIENITFGAIQPAGLMGFVHIL